MDSFDERECIDLEKVIPEVEKSGLNHNIKYTSCLNLTILASPLYTIASDSLGL